MALAGVLLMALAAAASAQVVVTVDGDTAHATISLTDNNGTTYDADVTIVFDTPLNLTPESLNLTAEIVDPADIDPYLPRQTQILCGGGDVHMDPAFPLMITIEPPDVPWLFQTGFDGGAAGGGLEFVNTYEMEIHTHDLVYAPHSPYRVMKRPVGEPDFYDITSDVESGSVRARGRHGAFSQFVVVSDTRQALQVPLLGSLLCPVYSDKTNQMLGLILGALIGDALRLDLLNLLAKVVALIPLDLLAAIDALDQLIATIDENAGGDLPNVWRASGGVTNSAGELKGIAEALRFTLVEHASSANP
jgi:hypothetical protein